MRLRSRFVLFRHCAALWPLQILFWLVPGAPGATIHVPADQPTIQAGINVANNGDTVLVAPGTYFENIDFKGKAITVTSSGGAASTILDGGSVGPAVTFKTSEPRAAVLSNMTIQHGGVFGSVYTSIGGIFIEASSPTVLNNVITQNNCWDIEIEAAAPLIQGNEISATQDPKGDCSFGGGAAIYSGGNLNNSAATPPIIIGNTIENNVESGLEDAGGNGGAGIAVWYGGALIENNILRNNSSPGGTGGAINIQGGSGSVIAQNLIYGNQAGCGGGAIAFNLYSSYGALGVLIANNTIVNNLTSLPDPGYTECTKIAQIYPGPESYGQSGPSAVIVNNILSGSSLYPAVNCALNQTVSEVYQPIFDHNILYNAGGAFFGSYCVDVSAKYGNVAADPKFVNAAGNDYHLQATSPAIDAGNNSALQYFSDVTGEQLAKDFDGNGRVQDATGKGYPVIDIGAYEYSGAVDGSPTTVVLTSSAYTGNPGSGYTLTATLESALGTPTGTVDFFLDGKSIGTSAIGSGGVATLGNFLMTPGVHNLYASYPGQGAFTPAISVIIIVDLNLYTTALTLSSSVNPSLPGQAVTFTVTATSADTTYIPSPITLTDTSTNTTLATLTPNSAGVANFTTSSLTNGANAITAVYAGDSSHAAASASLNQVVQGAAMTTTTTTLTSSFNPASFGQFVTFTATVANPTSGGGMPTGSVNFSDAGTLLSSQPLAAGSGASAVAPFSTGALAVGSHAITATYVPTGSFSTSSATLTEVIQSLATITTLGASPNPAFAGQTVTLSASVAGGVGAPAGAVSFFDGATLLNAGLLDASGHASFTTATLGVGSHTLTAVYGGSGTYSTSSSAAVTEVIQPSPQDFTIMLASPSLTIETQHHMTTNVTLTSVGGFADSLTVACGVLPAYVTCRLPSPVTLTANGSIAIALYLDTDSVLGYARVDPEALPGGASLGANLASILAPFGFFAAAGLCRRKWRCRTDLRLLTLLPFALSVALALSGCGRIVFPVGIPPSAAAGTYTIPITATGATTAITHTANLTLTVTP